MGILPHPAGAAPSVKFCVLMRDLYPSYCRRLLIIHDALSPLAGK